MKKLVLLAVLVVLTSSLASAQFSFHLIDNFEDGNYFQGPKWWVFGNLNAKVVPNKKVKKRDLISESCGNYALELSGQTSNWYIGGIGTDIGVDATNFSRFQIDLYGDEEYSGKLKIEVFDDDNNNYIIEQDPEKNYQAVYDDKWVAEVYIQGKGFTRTSIPFTAFRDANKGVGDDTWNPYQKDGSGGLLKMQLVVISGQKDAQSKFKIDNLLLTY